METWYKSNGLIAIYITLRIDNSGRSVIYIFDHISETILATNTYNISNKGEFFSLSYDRSYIYIKVDSRLHQI